MKLKIIAFSILSMSLSSFADSFNGSGRIDPTCQKPVISFRCKTNIKGVSVGIRHTHFRKNKEPRDIAMLPICSDLVNPYQFVVSVSSEENYEMDDIMGAGNFQVLGNFNSSRNGDVFTFDGSYKDGFLINQVNVRTDVKNNQIEGSVGFKLISGDQVLIKLLNCNYSRSSTWYNDSK